MSPDLRNKSSVPPTSPSSYRPSLLLKQVPFKKVAHAACASLPPRSSPQVGGSPAASWCPDGPASPQPCETLSLQPGQSRASCPSPSSLCVQVLGPPPVPSRVPHPVLQSHQPTSSSSALDSMPPQSSAPAIKKHCSNTRAITYLGRLCAGTVLKCISQSHPFSNLIYSVILKVPIKHLLCATSFCKHQ